MVLTSMASSAPATRFSPQEPVGAPVCAITSVIVAGRIQVIVMGAQSGPLQAPLYRKHDLILLLVRQRRVMRQRDGLAAMRLGLRKLAKRESELAVIPLQMHRDVVKIHTDAAFAQVVENLPVRFGAAAAPQSHHV